MAFPRLLTLVAALSGAALARPAPQQPGPKPTTVAICTPTTVDLGQGPQKVQNPIAHALENVGPGSVVRLTAGRYPPFAIGFRKASPWNARTSGGSRGSPILVQGEGEVRIVSKNQGDTIAIGPEIPSGHIVFRDLIIEPGYRAGVIFFQAPRDFVYAGYQFLDCHILGTWDHAAQSGGKSKWGLWGQNLADFVFMGTRGPARVEKIRQEHGFYLQNSQGDVTIQNVHGRELGRTFCQFTARGSDGKPGQGTITVRDCVIEDVAIAQGDDYKGGSAITLAGRHQGTVVIERVRYRAGFDPRLARLTRQGVPYGTGALVAWDSGGGPTRELVLRDNDFEIAPGCGDRPLVSIGGVGTVRLLGTNRLVSGASETLVIDPLGGDGEPRSSRVGTVEIDPASTIRGGVYRAGKKLDESDLAALAPVASEPEPARGDG